MKVKREELDCYLNTCSKRQDKLMREFSEDSKQDIAIHCLESASEFITEILEQLEFSISEDSVNYPDPVSEKGKMIDALFALIINSYDGKIEDRFTSGLIWTYLLKLEDDEDVDDSGIYPSYLWDLIKSYHANCYQS